MGYSPDTRPSLHETLPALFDADAKRGNKAKPGYNYASFVH
jgi:hypothetical protein